MSDVHVGGSSSRDHMKHLQSRKSTWGVGKEDAVLGQPLHLFIQPHNVESVVVEATALNLSEAGSALGALGRVARTVARALADTVVPTIGRCRAVTVPHRLLDATPTRPRAWPKTACNNHLHINHIC
ncbi:hypothetical protein PR048_024389 [Dryococelus australis]|uniref:Uncharacterized protein n=1 Tax=Dryococelus australis TaxID=614101 RepID=A0ABQ9GNH5_9NEOP|nr:hypothetical protein PR048_024389 [Dryococelus australis]